MTTQAPAVDERTFAVLDADGEVMAVLPSVDDLSPGTAIRPLELLYESPDNPRSISDERFEALKYALRKDPSMMAARPIIATLEGEIVAGNMRHRALGEIGFKVAPAFVGSFSDAQKREWMLRDNQEYGDWVPEDLSALVAAHQDEGGDLALLGFTDTQTEALLKSNADEEGTGGGSGGGGTSSAEVWGVVVECESEEQQAEIVDELAERGFEVRALIPT